MTRHLQTLITTTTCVWLLAAAASVRAADKWSRQLEPTAPGVSDSFDWVPLAQPVDGSSKDRSANARVLTYSQPFPPNGRFGDLPKPHNPPASQQQPFDFPYQFQRFLAQPQTQPLRQQPASPFGAGSLKAANLQAQAQEPTSQSFFKFEMPFRSESGHRPGGGSHSPSLQTGYQIQHFGGPGGAQATLFSSPLFGNQQPLFPPEFHPLPQKPLQQPLQQKPLPQQNFIEDTFPAKNTYRESKPLPTQQSLQSVTPQVFPVESQPDGGVFGLNKPSSFQQAASAPSGPAASAPANNQAQQDVQLLYVPYDTLYNHPKQNSAFEVSKYNVNGGLPAVNPYQINQFYTQEPLAPAEPHYYTTSTTNRPPATTLKPSTIFQSYAPPQQSTAKPKPKAHQPPLAMFLVRSSARPTQSDVVAALRNANTIAVIDAPTKQIPEIFVGPSGMPIPDGYVKFDLPYLSQLAQSRDLHDVSFFVAPLSYRTPHGFNKILLPEPHVGSIVINRAKDNGVQSVATQPPQQNAIYHTSTQPEIGQRARPNAPRIKQPQFQKDTYPGEILRDNQKNRNPFEVTTQRATLAPARGNKFNYFYDQDAIHEVTSPKITKHDRPKKKRPQNVQVEQPVFSRPYSDFQPQPNQIVNDNSYKVSANKPTSATSTSTSTSTSTTTSTTSTTAAPLNFFTFTNPQVEFQSSNGQVYHNFNTAPQAAAPAPEEHVPRFTTRPPPVTAEEEYRMKQYFRQQDAFRHRPQVVNPTNPPFEQVEYTPVDVDYDRETGTPSTTHRTTTAKQRITYYTPTNAPITTPEESFNTLPPQVQNQEQQAPQPELRPTKKRPSNHRLSYNQNEIPDSTVEYEPNPYQLPSELPPLTPNLPGLVNNLLEKEKQATSPDQGATTTPFGEKELPTRPSRRPINRVRKPVVSKVTSSVSYSESETSTRRPQRVRRPFGTRGSASASTAADHDDSETSTSSTRRPSSAARNPLIRNPNRIRYQPTPEERQTLKIKQRKHYGGSKKGSDDEDLDYQRDVLKQNYPIIKPASSRNPTSPTAIPSSYASAATESPTSETQQVYTVTPSNTVDQNEQTFPAGLLEPMQIAQQYSQYSKENYGPGYFPNQEDLNPTEPITRNEINPVFTTAPTTTPITTTTTTTTEEPPATTRRSPFIRRNYPRVRPTTTETPTTTTLATDAKSSIRPRIPPRKVIKVRARTRRPLHPASSTSAPEEEEVVEEPKHNYRKLNRFNQDLYENDPPRRRYKPNFQLDGQESQWSPATKLNNHHFKPLNPKGIKSQHKVEDEPEIVTLGPDDVEASDKKPDTFELNVSANYGPTAPVTKSTLKVPNLKPEKSFAELLEEVMGKAPDEKPLETEEDTNSKTTDGTYFESQKTTIGTRVNRRNRLKKLRPVPGAHNNESFETAESQNIGAQFYNSLYANGQQKSPDDGTKDLQATTPMTPTTAAELTTTPTPLTTLDEYDMTTPRQLELTTLPTTLAMDEIVRQSEMATTARSEVTTEAATVESATRMPDEELSRADDLDTQPSLFSEVKKQLHELFAIEEGDDTAVTAALAAVGRRRQEYTNIKRTKPDTTTAAMMPDDGAPTTEPTPSAEASKSPFHKNLMDRVVYATSTSTKVSSETEICYRGRCVRSEDLPPNHKLN